MKILPMIPIACALSNAATWNVGPGRTYTAPRAVSGLVADGDTVLIDAGTYEGEVATWSRSRLVLRGRGGFAHLVAPATISNGKAIWVVSGNDVVLDSIEFSGASVPDRNGAGIRAEGTNLTVRRSWFHDNEEGILGGKGHVRVEDSEFARNGFGDGLSHNLYIANCDTFSLLRSYSHHARIGHEVKSRAKVNILVGNWIGNETDGTASYEIDLPNGGTSIVIGNMIQQGSGTDNPAIVTFGEEGLTNPGKDLHFAHNTVVNDRTSGGTFVRLAAGASGAVRNNLWVGEGTFLSGTADTVGNLHGTGADLADRTRFDYRLAPTSRAKDAAAPAGLGAGWSLLPAVQPVRGSGVVARTSLGLPDVGAWEAGSETGVRFRPASAKVAGLRVRFDPRDVPVGPGRGVDGRERIQAGQAAPTVR